MCYIGLGVGGDNLKDDLEYLFRSVYTKCSSLILHKLSINILKAKMCECHVCLGGVHSVCAASNTSRVFACSSSLLFSDRIDGKKAHTHEIPGFWQAL